MINLASFKMLANINKKILGAIFLLSLLVGLSFIFTKPLSYLIDGDTEYVIYARNLINGNGFSLDLRPPYHSDVYRVPGYSFFLSLIYSIFGINNLAVMLIQVFLNASVCVLIFYLARRYFSVKLAYFASFLVAVYPFTAIFVHVIYSEVLCIFLFTLGIFLFEKGRESKNLLIFALSGIVMGCCLLVRPGTALMFLFMDAGYLLVENFKAIRKHLLVFNLCVILIWLPWIARNYLVSGEFIPLTIEAKEELFWASGSVGKYFENRMDNPKFISQLEEATYKVESSGLAGLQKKMKQESLYLGYAIKNIKDNPFLYLFSSIKRIPRMWISVLVPGDISRSYGFKILGGNREIFNAIRYFMAACLILAVYGLWIVRHKWKECIFLILPIIYFPFTHMFLLAEARFTLPARPYLLIFAVIGLLSFIKKIYPKLNIPIYCKTINN